MGIEPLQVWNYTPYEISLIAQGKVEKEKSDIKKAVIGAYYTEAFARYKRLPKLNKVLKDIDRPAKNSLSKGDMVLRAMAKDKGINI